MDRRIFLTSTAAVLLLAAMPAHAALSPDEAQKFISGLSSDAIGSLTGSSVTQAERETRFRSLLETHFDMPGISKFTLGRYWRVADQANTMRIIDLVVEGVSLRATHRSDFASAIQSNGGTIAALLDLL